MRERYANIIIDISHEKVDRPFTYRIPEALRGRLCPGVRVLLPFGAGNTLRTGYVIGLTDECALPPDKVKEIAALAPTSTKREAEAPSAGTAHGQGTLASAAPLTACAGTAAPDSASATETGRAIALAAWMREHYGSTMIAALKTVLPPRLSKKPVETRRLRLLLEKDAAAEQLSFYQKKHQVARERLLAAMMQTPVQPYELATQKLHVTAQSIRAMEKAGVLAVETERRLRNPVQAQDGERERLTLSAEQQAAVDGVLADFHSGRGGTSLLYGITGSGKTAVYIALIEKIVACGRQAVMLIPEIALTYQTLLRFYRHFGDRVSVMHSGLSEGEKADQFERARRGEVDVIIGPRSALFTPFPHIGVIVIDEEHENSYKSETMPKYHAREVAEKIAAMHGACVVLGSATPSMTAYSRAQSGDYRLYGLTRRLTGGSLPRTYIADLRLELKAGNRSILSRALHERILDRLARREQTMLFINRRGYAGFVSCRACGHVMKCPHCDVALTQHRSGRLVCHYCGHEQPAVRRCPECGSPYISGFRAGTEQIEEAVKKEFPDARVLRMDADTTRRRGDYDRILSAFANEEADILIGTQMIVKGHDFPRVTLVGVLCADLSLYGSDYRAAERTFQLLTQAAGRAGRGDEEGEAIIQTYRPDHYAVRYAAAQDYQGFYEEEMQYRQLLQYPPAAHMLAVQLQSKDEDSALRAAGAIRALLDENAAGVREVQAESNPFEQTGAGARTLQAGGHFAAPAASGVPEAPAAGSPSAQTGAGARTLQAGESFAAPAASGVRGVQADGSLKTPDAVIGPAPAALGRARDFYRFAFYIKDQKYDTLISWKDRIERLLREAEQGGERYAARTQVQFDFDPVNSY